MSIARGIRNNNPGNIDYVPRNKWQGQLGVEQGANGRFAVFDKPENGIRALAKLLLNYRGKNGMPGIGKPGIDTPLEFMSRWAPSNENDTSAYAEAIARRLGVGVRDSINIAEAETLRKVVVGVIVHENGGNPYSAETIAEGIRMSLL